MSRTISLPTGIELTPFRAEDGLAIRLTPESSLAMAGVDLMESFRLYESKGVGWTMRVGDTIVGCAGLMFPWPSGSFAVAWLLPSPLLPSYPKTVILVLLTRLREMIQTYQPRRIEFLVLASFAIGQRFAEFLDFRRDGCCEPPCPRCGLMRSYGPNGEDFIRYVWVREP